MAKRPRTPVTTDRKPGDRRKGQTRRYKWDQWLDGEQWFLEPGKDYDNLNVFRSALVGAAQVRGKTYFTEWLPEEGLLLIQAADIENNDEPVEEDA